MITVDTNILVYAVDNRHPGKQAIAAEVLDRLPGRPCLMALQVVGELQNVLRRKLGQPPWVAAQTARNILVSFQTFGITPTAAEAALTQMAAGRLSYWDAVLLASAVEVGCTAILSEDMQEGLAWNGIEVINPFGDGALSVRAAAELA